MASASTSKVTSPRYVPTPEAVSPRISSRSLSPFSATVIKEENRLWAAIKNLFSRIFSSKTEYPEYRKLGRDGIEVLRFKHPSTQKNIFNTLSNLSKSKSNLSKSKKLVTRIDPLADLRKAYEKAIKERNNNIPASAISYNITQKIEDECQKEADRLLKELPSFAILDSEARKAAVEGTIALKLGDFGKRRSPFNHSKEVGITLALDAAQRVLVLLEKHLSDPQAAKSLAKTKLDEECRREADRLVRIAPSEAFLNLKAFVESLIALKFKYFGQQISPFSSSETAVSYITRTVLEFLTPALKTLFTTKVAEEFEAEAQRDLSGAQQSLLQKLNNAQKKGVLSKEESIREFAEILGEERDQRLRNAETLRRAESGESVDQTFIDICNGQISASEDEGDENEIPPIVLSTARSARDARSTDGDDEASNDGSSSAKIGDDEVEVEENESEDEKAEQPISIARLEVQPASGSTSNEPSASVEADGVEVSETDSESSDDEEVDESASVVGDNKPSGNNEIPVAGEKDPLSEEGRIENKGAELFASTSPKKSWMATLKSPFSWVRAS